MSSLSPSWRDAVARYKFTLLLLALLCLVLAPLLVGTSEGKSLAFGLTFLAVLGFGVQTTVEHRRVFVVCSALGVLAGLAQIMSLVLGTSFYPEVRLALFMVFLAFLAGAIILDVLRSEAVTWDKIQGALCAYLLFGFAWALLFSWIALTDPQAFSGAIPAEPTIDSMVYYSFVTLTTLGYGDITPVSHTARTLAWLEAAFGQIYLVVLVARLVSMQLTKTGDGS